MRGYMLDNKIKIFLEDIKTNPSQKIKLVIYSDIPNSKIEFTYNPSKKPTLECSVYSGERVSSAIQVVKTELTRSVFHTHLAGFLNFFSSLGQGDFLPVFKEFYDFYTFWCSKKSS